MRRRRYGTRPSARNDGDDAQWAAAAAADLHRQADDGRSARGDAIEVREVLERRHLMREERHVRAVRRRLPVIDARGVDADGVDGALADEPARRVGMQPWEVQLRDRLGAA